MATFNRNSLLQRKFHLNTHREPDLMANRILFIFPAITVNHILHRYFWSQEEPDTCKKLINEQR